MIGHASRDWRRTGWVALQVLLVLGPGVLAVEYWNAQGRPAAPYVLTGAGLLLFAVVALSMLGRGTARTD